MKLENWEQYKKRLTRRGTNQYQVKYRNNWLLRLIILWLSVMFLVYLGCMWYEKEIKKPILTPLPSSEFLNSLKVKEVLAQEARKEKYTTSQMQVMKMITAEFEPLGVNVVKQALDIAWCESKWKENAINYNTNGSIDRGVFQINSIHKFSEYKLMAAWENINIAKNMFIRNHYSWGAWSCSRVLGYK